jgi:hypothetical protein
MESAVSIEAIEEISAQKMKRQPFTKESFAATFHDILFGKNN